MTTKSIKRWGTGAGLLAAGLVAGGVLAGSLTANAASSDPSPPSPGTAPQQAPLHPGDPTKAQRPDETLLTGDNASKARAAALAKYPGATIERVETDSDGVYEAHITKADGTRVAVEVDKSFAVTGEEQGGPGGHHGDHDGDGPGDAAGSSA